MSREHVITRGVFTSQGLHVAGTRLPADRALSRENVTAKVLCRAHNSRLSELDDEAIRLATAMRAFIGMREPGEMQVGVDGSKIERWCLKCAHNLLASRWMEPRDFAPDLELIEEIFGKRPLSPGAGLHLVKEPPVTLQSDTDRVSWNVFTDSTNPAAVQAFYIALHGLGLFVGPENPVRKLRGISIEGVDWSNAQLTYRPAEMHASMRRPRWPEGAEARMTIKFAW